MSQTNEQDKSPDELSELEMDHLPNKEFKVMIIKIIKKISRKMDAHDVRHFQ